MTTNDLWLARTAAALCGAACWISAPSIALSGIAAVLFHMGVYGAIGGAALACTFLMGVVQVYIAFRIALDRRIFELWSGEGGALQQSVTAFDAALASLGLRDAAAERSIDQRVRGALALIRRAVWILALQIALLVVALGAPK